MPRPDYAKDAEENKEFDKTLDPEGNFQKGIRKKPTLDQLREGVKVKQKLGERMFDAIEGTAVGSVQWLQQQAQEDPDRYTDDMLRLLGGGVKNVGWAISKIPFLDKIAQGEDWLAGQARAMSEELTPFLDPRWAGWGTRIGTGIIADKGIRKATGAITKGVKVSQAMSKAEKLGLTTTSRPQLGLQMSSLPNREKLAKALEGNINNPDWRTSWRALNQGRLSTPDRTYMDIITGKKKYPTLEDLELATSGPGHEASANWKYIRPSTPEGTTLKNWKIITDRLQKQFKVRNAEGKLVPVSDKVKKDFIKKQREAWKQVQDMNKYLNEEFKLNLVELANTHLYTELGLDMKNAADVKKLSGLIAMDPADLTYHVIAAVADANPRVYDIGHINAAKRVAQMSKPGIQTSADFASNLRSEMSKSLVMWINDKKKIVESGNLRRKARMDAPRMVNLLMGASPNVEIEWLRHIKELGYGWENIIPVAKRQHFWSYVKPRIRKWQGYGKNALHGKQQLDQYPEMMKALIDDYLNKLDKGEFLDDPAKSDWIDDILTKRAAGEEAEDIYNSFWNTLIREEIPSGKDRNRYLYGGPETRKRYTLSKDKPKPE